MLLKRSSGHSLPQNTFWKASTSVASVIIRPVRHTILINRSLLSPVLSPTLESSGTSSQCMHQSHTKLWAPGKVTSGMSQSHVIIAWADGESKIPIFGVKPPWWYQFSLCPMLSSVIKASRPSVWHQTQSKEAGQMLETLATTARVVFMSQGSVSWQYIHLSKDKQKFARDNRCAQEKKMLCDSPFATPRNALTSNSKSGSNAKSPEVLHVKCCSPICDAKECNFFPSIEPPPPASCTPFSRFFASEDFL